LPSSDRTFSRSFGFHGLGVSTRAPRALTFTVTPSCAGTRRSILDRSTSTSIGVRSSPLLASGFGDTGTALMVRRATTSTFRLGREHQSYPRARGPRQCWLNRVCPNRRALPPNSVRPRDVLSHERTLRTQPSHQQ